MLRYIEVTYGDNDFGWPVERALKRLWGFMRENNSHHASLYKQTPDRVLRVCFKRLDDAGLLLGLLSRLVDCEYLASDVEHATRGVHDMDKWPDRKSHTIKQAKALKSITARYLNLTIRFHRNRQFTQEWQNGEHAYLDLKTGEAKTF